MENLLKERALEKAKLTMEGELSVAGDSNESCSQDLSSRSRKRGVFLISRLPDVWRSINDLTWRIDYQTFLKLFFDVVHK
jgi:hypothetical protein